MSAKIFTVSVTLLSALLDVTSAGRLPCQSVADHQCSAGCPWAVRTGRHLHSPLLLPLLSFTPHGTLLQPPRRPLLYSAHSASPFLSVLYSLRLSYRLRTLLPSVLLSVLLSVLSSLIHILAFTLMVTSSGMLPSCWSRPFSAGGHPVAEGRW